MIAALAIRTRIAPNDLLGIPLDEYEFMAGDVMNAMLDIYSEQDRAADEEAHRQKFNKRFN